MRGRRHRRIFRPRFKFTWRHETGGAILFLPAAGGPSGDSSHRTMPAIDAGRQRRYSTKSRIADKHRTQEPQTLAAFDVR
jgi:hypothetical protein